MKEYYLEEAQDREGNECFEIITCEDNCIIDVESFYSLEQVKDYEVKNNIEFS